MKLNFWDFLGILLIKIVIYVADFFIRICEWFTKNWWICIVICMWFLLPFVFCWVEKAPIISIPIWHGGTISFVIFVYIWITFAEKNTKLWYWFCGFGFIHHYILRIKYKKMKKARENVAHHDSTSQEDVDVYISSLEDLNKFEKNR